MGGRSGASDRRTTHRLAALGMPVPSWMRAPGECPAMLGPEVAMDELAVSSRARRAPRPGQQDRRAIRRQR